MTDYTTEMMYRIASRNGVARNCIQLHKTYPYVSDIINVKELPEHRLPTEHDYEVSMINGRMVYWKDVAIPPYLEHRKDEILGNQIAIIDDDVLLNDLYLSAGNAIHMPMDFGTAGNGPKAISNAIALIECDNNLGDGYNAVVNTTQFYELCVFNPNLYMTDKKLVRCLLQGGDVYKSLIPESTGIVLPCAEDSKNRLIIYTDWSVEIIDELHNIYRVYASFELDIVDRNEICRLENI